MEALAAGARSIAQGHLHTRVPVHGSDEMAQLARSFNTMALAGLMGRGALGWDGLLADARHGRAVAAHGGGAAA